MLMQLKNSEHGLQVIATVSSDEIKDSIGIWWDCYTNHSLTYQDVQEIMWILVNKNNLTYKNIGDGISDDAIAEATKFYCRQEGKQNVY